MTGESILWGTLTILLALRWGLPKDAATDLAPSNHWAEPVVSIPLTSDRGPVLTEIEYSVTPERQAEFTAALRRFRSVRQRDGAIRWDVCEDVAQPGRVVEGFVFESWIEDQRQHERVTHSDALDQELLNAFHIGDRPPIVGHLLRPL
jgi:quinol monooxygenase YgiN